MSNDYFVICKDNDEVNIRSLNISDNTQATLNQMFQAQEQSFREGMEEIPLTGEYTPNDDEVFTISIPEQTAPLINAIINNPLSTDPLDIRNIETSNIKAVFTGEGNSQDNTVILIQQFSPQQILSQKLTLWYSGDTLSEFKYPAFNLNTKIVAIIENKKLKFKNLTSVRGIFNLTEIYRESTDEEVTRFTSRPCLKVDDPEAFKSNLNQTTRKLIYTIEKNGRLDNKKADEIKARATEINLEISIENGKIQMPNDRQGIKQLLQFINDDIYEAHLSKKRYVTNSKRPV